MPDTPPFICPVCASQQSAAITQETSPRGTVGIRRCTGCGLYFTHPRLSEPQGEYQHTTREAWQKKYGSILRGERLHDRHQNYLEEVAIIRQYVPTGRLLDVGCNAGWLLGYLQKAGGYVLEGVEPAPVLAEIARERLDIPIHQCYLNQVAGQEDYDALTATDVIEHLEAEHVNAFIDDMARLVKVGGYVFIKTPNARFTHLKSRISRAMPAGLRRVMLRAQDVWDAKEHTLHWTADTLTRIFRQHRFEVVRLLVPKMVETDNSPLGAKLTRKAIYATAQALGGGQRIPDFAQDILIVARKTG